MSSKKELIFQQLETALATIIAGNSPAALPTYTYANTVSYVDRQYLNFEQADAEAHPKPWIILNNIGELLQPYPNKIFEMTVLTEIIGFVEATNTNQNLDSLMNSLQLDVLIAILTDVELSGRCDFITPRNIMTVDELIHPYGGFVMKFEIVYKCVGLNF